MATNTMATNTTNLGNRAALATSFKQTDIDLLRTGKHSDMTITCQGRTWDCHRLILARSKWFEAACFSGFKETQTQKLDMTETDPDLLDLVLHHIYGEGVSGHTMMQDKPFTTLLRLLSLADFLQLDTLKEEIHALLSSYLDEKTLLACGDWKTEDNPQPGQPDWLDDLLNALRCAYELHGCDLARTSLIAFLWVTRHRLSELDSVCGLLEEQPNISKDLIRVMGRGGFAVPPPWFHGLNTSLASTEYAIHNSKDPREKPDEDFFICAECELDCACNVARVYNAFPVPSWGDDIGIGGAVWCESCYEGMVERGSFPWRGEYEEPEVMDSDSGSWNLSAETSSWLGF